MRGNTILYMRTDLGNQQLRAGGSVGHTLGVLRAYQQAGYRVIVASSALFPVLEKEPLAYWYRLQMPFFCRWLGTKISALFSTFFFLPRSLYLIIKYKPAYIYQRYSFLNLTGILASFITRIPLILEYNGSEAWIERYWTFKQKLRLVRLIALVEWFNVRYADCIVVVSSQLQSDLVQRGVEGQKIVVNPNAVDTQDFNPAYLVQDRAHIRTLLKIDTKIVVGFIGTFSAWHGINIIAQLIPLIAQQNNAIHFLLIGDGQLRSWVQQELFLYHHMITYTGTIVQEQAKHYLAACDMFICPTQPNVDGSPFFGSPTKLFEYMSLAKPVIASAIEPVKTIVHPAYYVHKNKHIVVPDACGLLVEPDDVLGFAYAVNLVARWSENGRVVLGCRARDKVIREHTWTKHVAQIMAHMNRS